MSNECTLTDNELSQRVQKDLSKLCKTGGKSFVMHVPARVNEDFDLLVGELIRRFNERIK